MYKQWIGYSHSETKDDDDIKYLTCDDDNANATTENVEKFGVAKLVLDLSVNIGFNF